LTGIITSSFFEGIGRRTFLKHGLLRTRIIEKWYDPIIITINTRESIEDFLFKLSFINSNDTIFIRDLTKDSLETKISLAKKLLLEFINSGELIFIVDDGGIVLPNNRLSSWFSEVIKDDLFKNQVSICIIAKFKPYIPHLRKIANILSFQVNELSSPDTQVLFLQYLDILEEKVTPEDTKFFLRYLKGIPSQVIYTAELIKSEGAEQAKKYIEDIESFDEMRAFSLFDFLKDDNLSRQILIALSKFEVISYDLIYKIFGEEEKVYKSLQKLFDLSVIFPVNSTKEYIKLNSSISDYISRARIKLDRVYETSFKDIALTSLRNPLNLDSNTDYSEFMLSLETMLAKGIAIPKKFIIPSFVLKTLIKEYGKRNFSKVIELAEKILENEYRFDYQIIRETKVWLCLSYCRTQNQKFFEVVNFFIDNDANNKTQYLFLQGFYFRNADEMQKAENFYKQVLEIDANHSRTKRELVNVYLGQRQYMKALNWAEENYHRFKTNILHIQAYFTCLIRKDDLNKSDLEMLKQLLDGANRSDFWRSDEIKKHMKAEYDYYIGKNIKDATHSLEELLSSNRNNHFAFRALIDIYKKKSMYHELEKLKTNYRHLYNSED